MESPPRLPDAPFHLPREMTPRARWTVLASCAVMIALRAPLLVLSPRLWAEEASVHLAYAYSNGFLRSLLLVPTSEGPAGYFQLPANLAATLAAHLLPLELAPAATLATAFAVQLLPFALVLWGRSYFWSTPVRRILCCAVLLFAPPITPPVWLSTINSQVFCGLAAFIILCEDLEGAGRRRIWCYRLVLAFCGLSGVYTAMLTVPFLVRAFLRRGRESAVQLAVVAGSAVLQAAVYAATAFGPSLHPDRLGRLEWKAASVIVLVQHVLKPIASGPLAFRLELSLPQEIRYSTVAGLASLAAVALVWIWLARRRSNRLYLLFPLTFAVVSGATSVLAFSLPRHRYAVISGMVLVLALLVSSWSGPPGGRRTLSRVLLGVSLAVGAATYGHDLYLGETEYKFGHFGYAPGRPDWSREVERWRRDPRHRLAVWPYHRVGSWSTQLPRWDEFRTFQEVFDAVEGFHLVAAERAAERRVAVSGVPADFRLVVRGRSGRVDARLFFTVLFEDGGGEVLAKERIEDLEPGEPFTGHFVSEFLETPPARDLGETRYVTFRARTLGRRPAVVHVDRVEIAPRVQGLLDGVLPQRTVPTRLYHASPRRPLAQEATPVLALESLLEDGDLVFGPGDEARAAGRWSVGASGLELRGTSGAVPVYDEAPPYLFAALPFFAAGGPSGAVVLNLLALVAMAALSWRDLARHGAGGKLFALAPWVAAAGFGFAFLPQPQVFEMFCLFVPVRWWLRGALAGSVLRLAAAGVLFGLAGAQEAAWLALPAACLADLASAGRRRAVLALAATVLAVVAVSALVPRSLLSPPSPTVVPPSSPAPSPASPSGEVPPAPAAAPVDRAVDAWRLYAARNGLIAGYPFVVLALVLFFRGAEERSRLLLFAALAVLTSWIAWSGAAAALESPLGSPKFAVIAPLFALLPEKPGSLRAQALPWAAALLLTLGIVSSVWTPAP